MTDSIDFFPIDVEQTDWQSHQALIADIRKKVFIEEQGVSPEEDVDGQDPEAVHWLAWGSSPKPMGTARLAGNKIGRMAVLKPYRKQGVGSSLLRAIVQYAIHNGIEELVLDAQLGAIPFYEDNGFSVQSDVFMDAGIPHRSMSLDLQRFSHRPPETSPPEISDTARQRLPVSGADDFRDRALQLARSSDRIIRIFSKVLDRQLYDQEDFCEAIFQIATRHPNADVRILVKETQSLQTHFHRLVEMFHRLTSRIQLRKLNPERETLHTDFIVGDEEQVLYNQLEDGYEGYFFAYAPLEARRLSKDFDSLWNSSEPDPAVRRLAI
ncbi:MAG: hypothetical protein CMK32_10630 [Porticoccaceae bacterium]|nr:hypothetical protein [Porticoccaceae bacterium]